MRRRRRTRFLLPAVVALLLTVPATPAAAHAELVGTDPVHGAIVDEPPSVIELHFNGQVTLVPEAFVLRSGGRDLPGEVRLDGTDVVFTPAGPVPDGTAVLDWRVVSDDGHPIGGKLVFHVREVTEEPGLAAVDDEAAGGPAVAALDVLTHLGLLLGGGLAFFMSVIHDGGAEASRLRRLSRALLAVGVAAGLASLALQAVAAGGRFDPAFLPTGSAPMAVALVLGALLASTASVRLLTVAGVIVAVTAPALVGHTRSFEPSWLVAGADAVHLFAASVWTGGLAGLALVARERRAGAADMTRRFGRFGVWCLLGVVLTGTALVWRLHGSWSSVVGTDHGRLVLVKVGLVAAAVLLALSNRFLATRPERAGRLASTTAVEATVLAAILVVAGFLVQQDPGGAGAATSVGTGTIQATLGEHLLSLRFDPGEAGVNTVTLTVLTTVGDPAVLPSPPRITITDRSGERVTYETEPAGDGFGTTVELPDASPWALEIRARVDTFTQAVQTIGYEGGTLIPGSGMLASGAVVPAPPGGSGTASVYMTLVPSFDGRLVAASSPVCGAVSLHESVVEADGTATMEPREEMELLASEPLVLESGGLHLMCEGVLEGLEPGDTVPLVLETAAGEQYRFVVDVVAFGDVLE